MRPVSKNSRRSVGRHLRGMLKATIMQRRRETVYRMLAKRNAGIVSCFVCGKHVPRQWATLEHVLPLSKGGTDEMSNLSISHAKCNHRRGNTNEERGDEV
ncbi:HNH endonuclease [Lysobacter enzymogenes]|uniref:HNH endonuclease n=1 Tax=Lysobacter enzymogenes TaxID=69 RepID=UPI001A95AB1B|nr:HNH endonuclease [Lysobacter enzymogenes]QQP96493.1 HNH endonuclease [Lysobacter enzymogenes]